MLGPTDPVTPDEAMAQWLAPTDLTPAEVPTSPAWFQDRVEEWWDALEFNSDAHHVLALALTVWIRRHRTARVFPVPHNRGRYTGRYHVHSVADNAQMDGSISSIRTTERTLRRLPQHSLDRVRDTWHNAIDPDIEGTIDPSQYLHHRDFFDRLSWDEILVLALSHWLRRHPYALVVPLPLSTAANQSPYHPQSWCVNADSQFLDDHLADIYGVPPERLTEPPAQLTSTTPYQPSHHPTNSTATDPDPFDDFR
jgi:hypothetical protein